MTANLAIAQLLLIIALGAVTLIGGIFRYRRSRQRRRGAFKLQAYLLWILTGLITLSSFMPLAHLYTEHLWFESLGHADVFWGLQQTRWGIFGVCFLIALGFMNINAAIANVLCPESREFRRWTHTQTFSFHRAVFCLTFIAALLLATPMLLLDDVYLRYRNQPRGDSEPRTANRESRTAEETMDGEPVRLETAPTESLQPSAVSEQQSAEEIGVREPVRLETAPTNFENEATDSQQPTVSNSHFGKDRNFYLFSFPFHRWVSLWVQITLWVTCIVVGLLYNFYYRRDAHTMQRVKRHIIFHGSVLWLLLLLVGGWRSYVHLWNKVYTSPLTQELSSLHGLFYVDFHLEGAIRIYCGVLVGVGIAVVFNIFWRKRLLWYATLGVWGLSYLLLIHIYPLGLHLWDARINVLDKEEPYLQRHIAETRLAFELDTIITEERVKGLATLDMITENAEIKKNIQIWDRRVLYEALREAQIQTHYDFHPYTDVDRYRVGDEYRQVLIAAREVSPEEDIVGWEPLKLQYTPGYGVCVSPVNEFIEDGFPKFWVADTPIRSDYDELSVQRPQIYYGEMTNNYVIVNSQRNIDDAARAAPETWERHTYTGDGGVPLGGWFRRLCFALRFDFFRMLRSERLTAESRVMFRRKIGTRHGDRLIKDRVSHIAPFLNYDPDPYIVISDGELWWIIDFYVTSQYYPNAQVYVDDTARLTQTQLYEEPDFKKFNYIRNSGVAVVNAYTGAVNFYAIKDDEAVMRAYRKAFPDLFKSVSEMPEGLRGHLRYPDYLTRIQAKMYGAYHRRADDFYHRRDRWLIPKEAYYSSEADQEMMPYYAMLKLPGEDTPEFVNMIPFTPPKREKRLKAWMVARCDPPHYGERIVYVLPEGADVAGPTQVEEDINKATGQLQVGWEKASDVIRGNLLIIPIEDALFYVEAIYLQAKKQERANGDDTQPRRPKLEMVVVKAGASELASAKTLDKALEVLFLGQPATTVPTEAGEAPPTAAELLEQLRQSRAKRDAETEAILEQLLEVLSEDR
ncbi:hypothetical protein F4Y59_02710 [Candidatus Poribacteria bacterium]|nr:hypothetical protein [Candidatus Poribacteria bacterium]